MNIKNLTIKELDAYIDSRIESKLKELLSDPDAGLKLNPDFVKEVQESFKQVESGGKTISLRRYCEKRGITL